MNIFVIGATGYIGRAVTAELLRRGHTVRGTARADSAGSLPPGATPVDADVRRPEDLARAAAQSDAVVYAVSYQGEDAFDVESAALRALAKALAPKHGRLLFTSGLWMYGNTFPAVADENSKANPIALVATRPELERIVLDAARDGVHSIVIRPGDAFGGGGGIPAMWVQSAREGGAARIVGDGGNHWAMIHLDDLAALYALALEKAPAGSAYIAVDETRFTVQAMAEAASRGAGKHGAVQHWPVDEARKALGPFADALAIDQLATSAKARAELDWHPHGPTALEDLEHGSYVLRSHA